MSDHPPERDGMEYGDPSLIYANYDPIEWGECGEEAGVPFFQFFNRCAMALGAMALAGAFFYMLEENKLRHRERNGDVIHEGERGTIHRLTQLAMKVYGTIKVQRDSAENSLRSPTPQRKLENNSHHNGIEISEASEVTSPVNKTKIISQTSTASDQVDRISQNLESHGVSQNEQIITNVLKYDESDASGLVEVQHTNGQAEENLILQAIQQDSQPLTTQEMKQRELETQQETEKQAKARYELLDQQIDEQMRLQREFEERKQLEVNARQLETELETEKLKQCQETRQEREEKMRQLSVEQREIYEEQRRLQEEQTATIIAEHQRLQSQLESASVEHGDSEEERRLLKELRMDSDAERQGEQNQRLVEEAKQVELQQLAAHRDEEREKCVTPTQEEQYRTGRPPTVGAEERLHDQFQQQQNEPTTTTSSLHKLATQISDAIVDEATGDVMKTSLDAAIEQAINVNQHESSESVSPPKFYGQVGGQMSIDLANEDQDFIIHDRQGHEEIMRRGHYQNQAEREIAERLAQQGTRSGDHASSTTTPPPSPSPLDGPVDGVLITQTPPTPPATAKHDAHNTQNHESEHNDIHADVQQHSSVEHEVHQVQYVEQHVFQQEAQYHEEQENDQQNVVEESYELRVSSGKRLGMSERSMEEPSATDAGVDMESLELDIVPDLEEHVELNQQQMTPRSHADVMIGSDVTVSDMPIDPPKGSAPGLHPTGSAAAPQMGRASPQMSAKQSHRQKEKMMRNKLKKQTSESIWEATGTTSKAEILHKYRTIDEWSTVMKAAGLMSCNLIFGIDYTASNKYQGEKSFNNRSLHSIQTDCFNPYQQVIRIMGKSLEPFATTGQVPVYGFGDLYTSDWSVFSLKNDGHCRDLTQVLNLYNEVTPSVTLSGPTNFAPLIYQAIEICQKVNDYHILVIVADGQVTNERATRRAIVDACAYPLSIIVVGVGDGPWQMMRVFDDSLPKRPWDNFHFVEFHELIRQAGPVDADLAFSVNALLEVPDQYKIIKHLGLLD